MLRLSGDAAETDVVTKLIDEARLIARQVVQDRFHAQEYSESAVKAKRIEWSLSIKSITKSQPLILPMTPGFLSITIRTVDQAIHPGV